MAKKQKKQSQPLRIEHPDMGSFGTVRTIESRLWFVNSPDVEYEILARLAQYTKKFGVKLYSFVFSGSHFHPLEKFRTVIELKDIRRSGSTADALRTCGRGAGGRGSK